MSWFQGNWFQSNWFVGRWWGRLLLIAYKKLIEITLYLNNISKVSLFITNLEKLNTIKFISYTSAKQGLLNILTPAVYITH